MFDEYDRYLRNEWNIDYWYDLGVIQAAELVDNFRDDDWQKLLRELSGRSEEWQVRCAETLGDVDCSSAFLVLEKLMATSSHVLLMAVIDAIRAQAHAGRKMPMTPQLEAALARARRHAGRIDTLVFEDFLKDGMMTVGEKDGDG